MPAVSTSEFLVRATVVVGAGLLITGCMVESEPGDGAAPTVELGHPPTSASMTPPLPGVATVEAIAPDAEPSVVPAPGAIEPQPATAAEPPPEVPEAPVPVVHPRRCHPPEGMAENPVTIVEGIEWINALLEIHGPPLDLLCVIESFHRPLPLFATSSRLSAQPADGVKDPRLFLFTGGAVAGETPPAEVVPVDAEPVEPPEFKGMTMSIVASGFGQFFLEFGQLTAVRRSIKAEVEFPVEQPLQEDSPYESLHFGVVTTCGLCHTDETPVFGITDAVESDAFRPDPVLDVPLEALFDLQRDCDSSEEPYRCEFLDAVLNHGEIRLQTFPAEMPTIFERSRELERQRAAELFQ